MFLLHQDRFDYNGPLVRHSLTDVTRASATISFKGNAITVYGATSVNHGAFTVALDGGVSMALNGSAKAFRPQNMLVRRLLPLTIPSALYDCIDMRNSTTQAVSRTTRIPYPL